MTSHKRLLGFAFAASDLLVELTPRGTVVFALGSGPVSELPVESLVGTSLFAGVGKASAKAIESVVTGMTPGSRSPAIEVLFAAGTGRVRRASVRLFALPDLAPNLSASVNWEGPAYRLHDPEARAALSPAAFLDRARNVLTAPGAPDGLAVAFVDILGLQAAEALGEAGERLNARVQAALQAASIEGNSTGQLGTERFAMLRDRSINNDLAGEVRELGLSEGLELGVRSSEVDIELGGGSRNTLRALRFAIETCLKDGGLERPELTFSAALSRTIRNADAFRVMVRERGFDLHYQPIVDLKTKAVHHFEALARFRGTNGPTDTIRMAEELALIDSFDIAVAEKALGHLRRKGSGLLKFAINVSGSSLADDRYVQSVLQMTAARPEERRRLIVEVTESAALADVDAANRRLGVLRAAGIKVCIDDFGAGSASYDYLRGLSVDAVKIDGRFMKRLETDPRARTMIGHLVELCASLKLGTIAEMIETQATADILRDLGVDFGQGWLFGKAEIEPRTLPAANDPARRLGEVVGWG
ncbi:diguanylate phosphodiesterase [Brevundimonas sp. LM2]|uniref:EAL domain-containing protein n=1 Tax=Brevundimonas sp. LM2 TaxID=1938605 RepID=UPI000983A9A0|nr:EAL domain-containing protein [Brevundimonas sp. LM2]AQR62246.1 diguanylate phosphodiesterase [Brevundimonas sp. LM2]